MLSQDLEFSREAVDLFDRYGVNWELFKLSCDAEAGTYHGLLFFLDLLMKLSSRKWLWVARGPRAGGQR